MRFILYWKIKYILHKHIITDFINVGSDLSENRDWMILKLQSFDVDLKSRGRKDHIEIEAHQPHAFICHQQEECKWQWCLLTYLLNLDTIVKLIYRMCFSHLAFSLKNLVCNYLYIVQNHCHCKFSGNWTIVISCIVQISLPNKKRLSHWKTKLKSAHFFNATGI